MSIADELNAAYDGDDLELRTMMEQEALIREMQAHPGWQAYKDALYSRLVAKQRRMMLGECKTIEDYRQDSGFVQGMTEAADHTLTRIQRAIDARREALLGDPEDGSVPDGE